MAMKLPSSSRLETLADFLPPLECVADIGTDHAWLLIRLILMEKIQRGIGVEVVKGPYERAVSNVENFEMEKDIEIRMGDGLAPLNPGEQQGVIIAGMGGSTMEGILERSPEVIGCLKWLLLQPMGGSSALRGWLQRHRWQIVKESLVKERGIIYPIILATPGEMNEMSDFEATYGPLNLAQSPPLLFEAMQEDLKKYQRILEGLNRAKDYIDESKKAEIEAHIRRIKEWIQ